MNQLQPISICLLSSLVFPAILFSAKPACLNFDCKSVHLKALGANCSLQPVDTTLRGEIKTFYKSGKIKEISHLVRGVREGLILHYDANGNLTNELSYKGGLLDGVCKWIGLKEGAIWQVDYKEGVRNGKWLYYENGHKRIEASFVMGKLEDWAYGYYPNGAIQLSCAYRDGVLISSEDRFDEEGRLASRAYPGRVPNRIVEEDKYDSAGNIISRKIVDRNAELHEYIISSIF